MFPVWGEGGAPSDGFLTTATLSAGQKRCSHFNRWIDCFIPSYYVCSLAVTTIFLSQRSGDTIFKRNRLKGKSNHGSDDVNSVEEIISVARNVVPARTSTRMTTTAIGTASNSAQRPITARRDPRKGAVWLPCACASQSAGTSLLTSSQECEDGGRLRTAGWEFVIHRGE